MPQLIIGILVIGVVIQLLSELFKAIGQLISALFLFIGWFLYSLSALADRLFGQWGNSPAFSWGLSGMILGTTGYFVTKEANKLSRPLLAPLLISSCCIVIILAPFIGPKTGSISPVEKKITRVATPTSFPTQVQAPVIQQPIISPVAVQEKSTQRAAPTESVATRAQLAPAQKVKSGMDEVIAGLFKESQRKNRDIEFRYGEMLLDGNKIAKNTDQGISLLKQSAEHGSSKAQKRLGYLYYQGDKITKDLSESAKYYRMAAEGGLSDAQYFYGVMLASGTGVLKNRDEALVWIRKAANQGHKEAKQFVAEVENSR